jgi:phage shock protein PspC (stress-responsive transcriptional regulator)
MFSYLLHQGFVRVAFMPTVMGVIIYALYALAAPSDDDEDAHNHNA